MQSQTDDFPCFLPDDPRARLRETEALADSVSATLRLSQALLAGRRHVDLAGLDRVVGRLCAGALDLPPEQGRTLRERLIRLHDELEKLSDAAAAR
jgi:hypothetical protein